jgi:glycosyltransferase involved in cell wall biosynthesis
LDVKAGISAVIITHNEAQNIGRCITSVQGLVDEVLVVDSFSMDATVEIAQKHGAQVLQHTFEGHIQQKNWAKDQASFDWVLSLDADECLSDELKNNLQTLIAGGLLYGKTKGYFFSRLNHLGNRPIKGCGWYPDKKMRLWDRRCGLWSGKNPHDKFVVESKYAVSGVDGDILHYTYPNLEAVKLQALKFGEIGGLALREFWKITDNTSVWQALFLRRSRGIYWFFCLKLITAGPSRFLRNYVLKGGWKYGKDGFNICYWQMVEASTKYRWALIPKK